MRRDVAREIIALMLETMEKLDRSVARMRAQVPPAEFGAYGRAVATILADIIVEVLDPLYARHPELKPPEAGRRHARRRPSRHVSSDERRIGVTAPAYAPKPGFEAPALQGCREILRHQRRQLRALNLPEE